MTGPHWEPGVPVLTMPADAAEFSRRFYRLGWTDGLPVIPPTRDRVAAALAAVPLPPQAVVGAIPPSLRDATVELIAINAVLAGCDPEHLPVVLAAVQAAVQEPFNLRALQTTTHPSACLIIVNGPIRGRLGLNSGSNAFGPGHLANAAIGRALALTLKNIGSADGFRFDRSTQGHPGRFTFCIAENEEASPWPPLHVARGFAASQSVVTLVSTESPHNVNDHGSGADGILNTICDAVTSMANNNAYLDGTPVLALCPEHAAALAREGLSREDVQHHVFMNARNALSKLQSGGMWQLFGEQVTQRADARGMVPVMQRSEDLQVLVVGGPGRHSCWLPTYGITAAVDHAIAC